MSLDELSPEQRNAVDERLDLVDLDEIRQLLIKWLQTSEEITLLSLSMVQCQLLLKIAEQLERIDQAKVRDNHEPG